MNLTTNTPTMQIIGDDCIEFLMANGWQLPDFYSTSNAHKYIDLTKKTGNTRINMSYIFNDYGNMIVAVTDVDGLFTNTKRIDLPKNIDVFHFACLCFGMGLVTPQEANLNCKAESGQSLGQVFAEAFAGTARLAKSMVQEVAEEINA